MYMERISYFINYVIFIIEKMYIGRLSHFIKYLIFVIEKMCIERLANFINYVIFVIEKMYTERLSHFLKLKLFVNFTMKKNSCEPYIISVDSSSQYLSNRISFSKKSYIYPLLLVPAVDLITASYGG